ncbi:restriction endonuclease [Eggerthellaceae bacterium zg-887]|nr:restriction endonuclease [Xiamenia xianingshaonis]
MDALFQIAQSFADAQSEVNHISLLGTTDGKAVGTYVEHLFEDYLTSLFPDVMIGNSARGIDLPDPRLKCDIKVTSIRQPQSSCPYRDSRQKIYGLGYNLLLFVYEKIDHANDCELNFRHVALIDSHRTADFTLTRLIRQMLENDANIDDMIALFEDKALPGDEITLTRLAEEVFDNPPHQGYLTISNALQWRLQYSRVISLENGVNGVSNYDR